ncbi:MAG: hypothetical protein LUE93_10335, partial [Bacteroides sp.]|nr:hypothetical protein [Bacteroides sp.]
SQIPNNALVNIDLNWLASSDDLFKGVDPFGNLFSMLGLYGKRSEYMVSRSVYEFINEWYYTYETDSNGTVTKIRITNSQNNNEVIFELSYLN